MRFNSGALFRPRSATHDVGSAFRGLKPPGYHRFTATRWEPLFAREESCLTPHASHSGCDVLTKHCHNDNHLSSMENSAISKTLAGLFIEVGALAHRLKRPA